MTYYHLFMSINSLPYSLALAHMMHLKWNLLVESFPLIWQLQLKEAKERRGVILMDK